MSADHGFDLTLDEVSGNRHDAIVFPSPASRAHFSDPVVEYRGDRFAECRV
jgi:hypothetical protein